MLEALGDAAPVGWIILHFGVIGAVGSVAALIAARHRAASARPLGAVVVMLGVVCALLGTAGVVLGRSATNRAVAHEEEGSPIQRQRIKQEGYGRARAAGRVGLVFAALPLLAGFAALMSRPRRTEEEELVDAMREPWPTARGRALTTATGILACGVAGVAANAPVPSRGVVLDATAWEVLDAVNLIQQTDDRGRVLYGCRKLEEALADGAPPPRTIERAAVRAADRTCVEERIQEAAVRSPLSAVRVSLEEVLRSSFVKREPESARPVEAALAEVRAAEANPPPPDPENVTVRGVPLVRMGEVEVNGSLHVEVVRRIVRQNFGRFRLCYENGLRRRPTLAGTATVRFEIGRDGQSRKASNAGSTISDPEVVACVVRAFGGLSFPQPEDAPVVVVYPIHFTPPEPGG